VQRQEHIEAIRDQIESATSKEAEKADAIPVEHYTDYRSGDYDILVEIFKDILMLGIVRKYKLTRKYNLEQLQAPSENPSDLHLDLNKTQKVTEKTEAVE